MKDTKNVKAQSKKKELAKKMKDAMPELESDKDDANYAANSFKRTKPVAK